MSDSRAQSVRPLATLVPGTIGIVNADIATSPIYSMKALFGAAGGVPPTAPTLPGDVWIAFSTPIIVVSLEYVMPAEHFAQVGRRALAHVVAMRLDESLAAAPIFVAGSRVNAARATVYSRAVADAGPRECIAAPAASSNSCRECAVRLDEEETDP